MTRLILFLLVCILIPLAIRGQGTISVEPASFIMTGNPTQTDIAAHILVTNTSTHTINLYWSKRMSNSSTSWFSWICDRNLCYLPDVNSCPDDRPNLLQ